MPYHYQQPRIAAERNPWQSFFEGLPDMLLSFHQMKLQAEEKEKDRQHQEYQLYLRDKLDTKRMLQTAVISATNDARDRGLTATTALDAIFSKTPVHATGGSTKVSSDFADMLKYDVDNLSDALVKTNEDIRLADLGVRDAFSIDTNFDSFLSPDEIDAYQKASPEILNALDIEQLPESYLVGAKHHLTKPKVREYQAKKAKINNTGKYLEALGNMPEFKDNKHLLAATAQFHFNPSSAKVLDNIGKMFTEQPEAAEAFKKRIETTDITFRNYVEQLGSLGKGVDKDFFKGLKILGTEDFKAKSLTDPAFVSSFKNDLAENFATWFSGKTREGRDYKGAKDPVDWIGDAFNAAPAKGWDNASAAVEQVMAHTKWGTLISDPDKLRAAFNWTGAHGKEVASANFFLKSVDLYDAVDDIEGNIGILGSGFMKLLGDPRDDAGGGVQVPADSTQVPAGGTNVVTPADSSQAVIPEGFSDQSEFLANLNRQKREQGPLSVEERSLNRIDLLLSSLPAGVGRNVKHALREGRDPVEVLQAAYTDPNIPPSLAQNIAEALNLLQKESRDESVNTLEGLALDHRSDPALTKSVLSALDRLDNESQLEYLVEALTKSRNIRIELGQTGQDMDILKIIDEWQSEGSPDVGDWLADTFESIEPELIK